jgi:drug/metabolite transporter (DMT)-like permease
MANRLEENQSEVEQKAPCGSDIIPVGASALLLGLCILWGGNLVSVKIISHGIPPFLAAGGRSAVAAALLWAYAWKKGEPMLLRSGDFWHGIAIGTLFGLDYLFLFWGTVFTDASRAVIFLYTYPLWVTVGAHFFIPDDRLTMTKMGGLGLAFAGLILVFGAQSSTLGPRFWLGDLMEVAAAIFWASAILYVKRIVRTRVISHIQTLSAQLLFSIPVLILASLIFEWGQPLYLTVQVILAFAYQCLVVAFWSYLLWLWLIHRFAVSRLSVFTFLVPFCGVIVSGLVLHETPPPGLWLGLGFVAAGIYLVNRREKISRRK